MVTPVRKIWQDQVLKGESGWLAIDLLPASLKQCIHEYGLPIVKACFNAGVRDAGSIHSLVREIWDGARQEGNRGQRNPSRTARHSTQDALDWILIQSGSSLSSETLVRALFERGLLIVPREPTEPMIAVSMNTVGGENYRPVSSKREKHRLRLRAANESEARRLYPGAFRKTNWGKS